MAALWAVLGGTVAIVLGIIGLVLWWSYFLSALMATLPALFVFGGAIALFIGISEIRDSLKSKEEIDTSDFNTETKVEEDSTVDEKPEESKEKAKKPSKKE